MDQDRFDGIARALASGTSRRGALLAALGALAGVEAPGGAVAAARRHRRKRKKCDPPCAAGQTCVKRTCRCDNGGTVCGANCCLIGQRCEGGTCVDVPEPGQCAAYGEACKDTGVPCCDNLQCGSGQGGAPVACWVRETGTCASTAECIYGTECKGGVCVGLPPAPTCVATTCPDVDAADPPFASPAKPAIEPACVGDACGYACRPGVTTDNNVFWPGVSCSADPDCPLDGFLNRECADMNTGQGCAVNSTFCCCNRDNNNNTPSDASLKTSVEPMMDGADLVRRLRPVRFDWTPDANMGNRRQVGLIAQEVREAVPEVVGESGGHLTVDYAKLVAPLIGAVQAQQRRIEELEERLRTLEARD